MNVTCSPDCLPAQRPPRDEERAFLSVAGAALYLGLSTSTLNRLRVQGGGPRYAKLGRILYRRVDLDAYVNARLRNSTSEYDLSAAPL
jgi:hypothetical protein